MSSQIKVDTDSHSVAAWLFILLLAKVWLSRSSPCLSGPRRIPCYFATKPQAMALSASKSQERFSTDITDLGIFTASVCESSCCHRRLCMDWQKVSLWNLFAIHLQPI